MLKPEDGKEGESVTGTQFSISLQRAKSKKKD